MVTSVWAANLVWVLLGVNWLLEGWSRPGGSNWHSTWHENWHSTWHENWHSTWHEKWEMARKSRLLHAFVAIYLLYVIGMLWTSNTAHGLNILQVKLPLLLVPLVVLTSKPVGGHARRFILAVYTITTLVVSIIALVRMLTIPDLPYRDAVPYISHIRFALNCCMVIYLVLLEKPDNLGSLVKIGRGLLVLWMLVFLALIHSYTAYAILAVVSLVLLLTYYRRWPLVALWLLMAGTVAFLIGHEVKSYYRLIPQATEPLPTLTAGGRPYEHWQDGIIENGNYINNYLCPEEMRAEWQRRSTIPYDSIGDEGYTLQPTLVRYLNALGLTKDSVGVNALTADQVRDIERGIANPVYESGNPIRKMVYVLLFEREYYVHTHAVLGFTMIQRIELWRATLDVVHDNLRIGVGTGDVDDALHARLAEMDSSLSGTRKSTHNQYLALLAAFGVIGVSLLLFFFLRTCVTRRASRLTPLMLAWMLTILISFLTEDTLDTLAGILFCTYFLAFRTPTCTNTTHSATESA